ncbi:MAG TPA: SDR family NAD(P)-dependent oxidoreductase [Bryobacteraceae bacterium]|jgi:uncharacterized protein YbjT (DUF2867 family)|nr:SDR family NAD(P)-dependent oxidoreductase [Bryobacteraceae bacterium]
MYLITGATGNTGSVVAKGLLKQGKKVRVVARSQEKLKELASLGAETLTGDITSQDIADKAFAGIEAAYLMIPPAMTDPDFRGYQRKLTEVYGSALEANSSVKHVVVLSSFGADKDAKTGPILGLHFLEERLKQIKPLNSLSLRAGYFMENTLGQANVIHQMGAVVGPLKPDLEIPLIATIDIGNAALNALLQLDFTGHQTRELQGQRDLTYLEITAIIGTAIGKPDLQYQVISSEQFAGFLEQMGWAHNVAALMAEMVDAQNAGHIRSLEPRSASNTTPTSFEQFVAETFVPAYNASH